MIKKSNMHYRRKYNFNVKETAIIDEALSCFEKLFRSSNDKKMANDISNVRKSLIHQEQSHWNKENGFPKGFLIKKKRK